MQRKVNLVGSSTLTVSLPSDWASANNIHKGDYLNYQIIGPNILFSGKPKHSTNTILEIDTREINTHILAKILFEAYVRAVNTIQIAHSNNRIRNDRTQKSVELFATLNQYISRYIGMEITKQTKNTIVIENLVEREQAKLETVARRIYYLTKEFMNMILLEPSTESANIAHEHITRFVNYYLRLLNYSNYNEATRMRLFSTMLIIDKYADKLRHVAEQLEINKKTTPKLKQMMSDSFEFCLLTFELLFTDYNPTLLAELSAKRYDLRKRLLAKWSAPEYAVLVELGYLLETLNDFSYLHLSIHWEKAIKTT